MSQEKVKKTALTRYTWVHLVQIYMPWHEHTIMLDCLETAYRKENDPESARPSDYPSLTVMYKRESRCTKRHNDLLPGFFMRSKVWYTFENTLICFRPMPKSSSVAFHLLPIRGAGARLWALESALCDNTLGRSSRENNTSHCCMLDARVIELEMQLTQQ